MSARWRLVSSIVEFDVQILFKLTREIPFRFIQTYSQRTFASGSLKVISRSCNSAWLVFLR